MICELRHMVNLYIFAWTQVEFIIYRALKLPCILFPDKTLLLRIFILKQILCCFKAITVDFPPAVSSSFGKNSSQFQLEFPIVFHMQDPLQFNLHCLYVTGVSSVYVLIWYTCTHKCVHSKWAFFFFWYISISRCTGDTDHQFIPH